MLGVKNNDKSRDWFNITKKEAQDEMVKIAHAAKLDRYNVNFTRKTVMIIANYGRWRGKKEYYLRNAQEKVVRLTKRLIKAGVYIRDVIDLSSGKESKSDLEALIIEFLK